jgi:hypothetical protein
VELKLALGSQPLQTVDKLAREHRCHGMNGEEEAGLGGTGPSEVRGESAACDQAVEVGMVHEVLPPGVEESGDANLGVELVLAKFQERVGRGLKKQRVDELLVLQGQGTQLRRQPRVRRRSVSWVLKTRGRRGLRLGRLMGARNGSASRWRNLPRKV